MAAAPSGSHPGRLSARKHAAAVAVPLAAVWAIAAWLLWRSEVPGGLALSGLDPHRWFTRHELAASASYGRFVFWDALLAIVVQLAVLAAYARWGARWMRESAAGPIGTGVLLGMLGFLFVWISQVPFTLAQLWWDRRHGLSQSGYLEYLTQNWAALAGEFVFVSFALLVVMGLARRLGERWWIAGAPVFVGLGLLFAFVQPWLLQDVHSLKDAGLARSARVLERREGAAPTPVRVEDMSRFTSQANAFTTGLGPSRRIVLWDTLLDGRFSRAEVRVVIAHEIGHVARSHIWKGIGWSALFAFPGAFLIARLTRRRGGMGVPEAVPVGLLVLVALQFAALPLQNVISRHLEAEADWLALEGARDPAAQAALFKRFAATSLEEPSPGLVDYVLFENHPTLAQRIAMVQAWRARQATSTAQSP